MNIKAELETQLKEIEDRCRCQADYRQWPALQVAKSNILLALQKYEAKPLRDREVGDALWAKVSKDVLIDRMAKTRREGKEG